MVRRQDVPLAGTPPARDNDPVTPEAPDTDRRVENPDPVTAAYRAGVDISLLRDNLAQPVEERFRRLMALQRFAEELQRAGRAARRSA